jgi:transposase-like protein
MDARSKYRPEIHPDVAAFLARRGLTLREVAKELEINLKTLNRWRKTHPEFSKALDQGRMVADARVEGTLIRKALGYTYSTERMSRSGEKVRVDVTEPPDTTAIIFWLKNRLPEEWRDRREIDHGGEIGIREARRKLADLVAETIGEAESITAQQG